MRDDPRTFRASGLRSHPTRHSAAWLLAGALLLAFVGRSAAQTPDPGLTLSGARALAQRVSPDVTAAQAALEAAAGRERQAGALPNPILAYSHEQASLGGSTNAQDIASLEQRIEIGGQRGARVTAARLTREAAGARLVGARADVDLAVTRAYAEAVAADRRAELAGEAAGQFQGAVRVIQARLSAGDASGYAARRLRLEAARYAALAAEARLEQRDARLRLNALTGAPSDTALAGFPTLAGPADLAADSVVALALRSAPELRAARLTAGAAEAEAALARRERIPTPVASLGYKRERPAGADDTFHGLVAGVSIPLPVWDRRGGAIAAAEAEERRADAGVEALARRIRRESLAALEAARQADAQADALGAQLGSEAQLALRAAQAAYTEGEITLVEWLDAVRAYQEAEAAHARLLAEATIQRATLERLLGVALIR